MKSKKLGFYILGLFFSVVIFAFGLGLAELTGFLLLKFQIPLPFIASSPKLESKSPTSEMRFKIKSNVDSHVKYANKLNIVDITLFNLGQTWLPSHMKNGLQINQPNIQMEAIAKWKTRGEPVYKIKLQTDEVGRRLTPELQTSIFKSRHLIFMGCSYTFGEGIDQYETIPYNTAKNSAKDYKAYNLGLSGGSPDETLAAITRADFLEKIPEKNGIAVYTFIDGQILRTVGDYRLVAKWIKARPLTEKNSAGQWVAERTWSQAFPVRVLLSNIAAKSYVLKWLKFMWPIPKEADFQKLAEILNEIKKEYHKKFGAKNRFVVMFFFEFGKFSQNIIPYLEKYEIEYLDYSTVNLGTLVDKDPYILNHPSAAATSVIGQILAEDLGLKSQSETVSNF